jgi:multiple sugar transport system permease protein
LATVSRTAAPGPRLRAWRWASGFKERDTWAAYAFLSPWLFGFVVLTAGPMVASFILSLTDYDIISSTQYVGLENYRQLVDDPQVSLAIRNTLVYTAMSVPATIIVSLGLAMMLARVGRAAGIFRTIFYMPVMTPAVAVGVLYLLLFNGDFGLVNRVLELVGINGPYWTSDPHWIKPGLVLIALWAVGSNVVIYLAAITGVPQQLYDAAAMDGASKWRQFKDVTLPMISPAIFFTFIILTIAGLQTFEQVYTAFFNANTPTGNDAALFYVIYLFQQAFTYLHMGYASALAWLLFGIIAIVTAVQIVLSRRFVYYEGER